LFRHLNHLHIYGIPPERCVSAADYPCSILEPGYFAAEGSPLQEDCMSAGREVPFGWDQFHLTGSSVADYVLGNWELGTIFVFRSCQNFTVTSAGDIGNTGNGSTYERANIGISTSAATWRTIPGLIQCARTECLGCRKGWRVRDPVRLR
jgi:hypothetical protein